MNKTEECKLVDNKGLKPAYNIDEFWSGVIRDPFLVQKVWDVDLQIDILSVQTRKVFRLPPNLKPELNSITC